MVTNIKKAVLCLITGSLPIALFAFSSGPVIKRTGAPADGGLNCSACHRDNGAANSDPRGSVKIEAVNYKPGIPQTIKVTVQHPDSSRWGFQLTARPVNDEIKMAGTFTVDDAIRVRCDPNGLDAPCNGALEFAEHREPTTHIGSNGSATFLVEWTPPANDVGAIVFYAAGNAANGDGNLTGDHIYTTSATILNGGSCTLSKKPNLGSVVDAAAFKPGLAMNSLFTLYGSNFQVSGSSRTAGPGDYVNGKFPPRLGCVAVEVAGKRVPITYVQTDQINAQIPTLGITGPVSVQVILNPDEPSEVRSDPGNIINIQNYAPVFFAFKGSSSIAALIAGTGTYLADPSVVPTGRPAKPGEFVSLFGTGFGPTNPTFQAGELVNGLAPLRDPVTVTIGGTTVPAADVQFAGATPGSINGLYQINVRVPATAADGDVPVSVRIGGVDSPPGSTIPVERPI